MAKPMPEELEGTTGRMNSCMLGFEIASIAERFRERLEASPGGCLLRACAEALWVDDRGAQGPGVVTLSLYRLDDGDPEAVAAGRDEWLGRVRLASLDRVESADLEWRGLAPIYALRLAVGLARAPFTDITDREDAEEDGGS